MNDRGTPLIYLSAESRCVVTTDCALSFGKYETYQYARCHTGAIRVTLGERNRFCWYPAGVGETA